MAASNTFNLLWDRFNIILETPSGVNPTVSQTNAASSKITAKIYCNNFYIEQGVQTSVNTDLYLDEWDRPQLVEYAIGREYDIDSLYINVSIVNENGLEISEFKLLSTQYIVLPHSYDEIKYSVDLYNKTLKLTKKCKIKVRAQCSVGGNIVTSNPIYSTTFTVLGTNSGSSITPDIPVTFDTPSISIRAITKNTEINYGPTEAVEFTPIIYDSNKSILPIKNDAGNTIQYKISVSEQNICDIDIKQSDNSYVSAFNRNIDNASKLRITNKNASTSDKEISLIFELVGEGCKYNNFLYDGTVFTVYPIILLSESNSIVPVPPKFELTSGSYIIPYNNQVAYKITATDRQINSLTISNSNKLNIDSPTISNNSSIATGTLKYPKTNDPSQYQSDTTESVSFTLKYKDGGTDTITKSFTLLKAPAAGTFSVKLKITGNLDGRQASCEYIISNLKLAN